MSVGPFSTYSIAQQLLLPGLSPGHYFNPLDYGANPLDSSDVGLNNNRIAIQACIDNASLNGGTVIGTPGRYNMQPDGSNTYCLIPKSNVTIMGLAGPATSGVGTRWHNNAAGTDLFFPGDTVSINNFNLANIRLSGGRDTIVITNKWTQSYLYGVSMSTGSGTCIHIKGNAEEIYGMNLTLFPAAGSGYGIYVENAPAGGVNSLFDKCTFIGVTTNGGLTGVRIEPASSTDVNWLGLTLNTFTQHGMILGNTINMMLFLTLGTEGSPTPAATWSDVFFSNVGAGGGSKVIFIGGVIGTKPALLSGIDATLAAQVYLLAQPTSQTVANVDPNGVIRRLPGQVQYINAAGRVNGADSDFSTAPADGTTYVIRNSTTGAVFLTGRASGAWYSVQVS